MFKKKFLLTKIIWLGLFIFLIHQEYSHMMEGRSPIPIRWLEEFLYSNKNFINQIEVKTYLLTNFQLEMLYRGNLRVLEQPFNKEAKEFNLVILTCSKGRGWGVMGWRLDENSPWNKINIISTNKASTSSNIPSYQIYAFALGETKDLVPENIKVKWFSMNTK
jgi:hypothetical protein